MDPVYEIADKYDVELLWQPFSAKASGQPVPQTGIMPDKLSYLFEDTKRLAAERGLGLTYPENWPETEPDPGRLTRGALIANDMGVLLEYNVKVFNKWWGLGENPNEDAFMNELCDDLDIDLGEVVFGLAIADTVEAIRECASDLFVTGGADMCETLTLTSLGLGRGDDDIADLGPQHGDDEIADLGTA
jgi:2-hydroxychromene-2-carboxylate isomerase